jgi:pimeloyl-ACP methyl ester carboxylesterase
MKPGDLEMRRMLRICSGNSLDMDLYKIDFETNFESVFHGTALDTSLLIDHLGSYIFHGPDAPLIEQHIVAGVSLGGHAAWQVLFNDPRVTAAVIIIGCPDYARKYRRLRGNLC